MSKRVVVIASGETERRSLPFLLDHLAAEGITIQDVRIPPRHRAIKTEVAEKDHPIGLVRVHGRCTPAQVRRARGHGSVATRKALAPIRNDLPVRLHDINASIQFAYAQQHLEAWYFADAKGLRRYVGRDLGAVSPTQPDAILNPKLHLKHLLGARPYTSLVSRDITSGLDTTAIAQHSPSFRRFLAAVRNGGIGEPQDKQH